MKTDIEKKKRTKILLIVLTLTVIAGIGFGVYCWTHPDFRDALEWRVFEIRLYLGV